MRLTDLGIDSPCGFDVAVECMADRPAVLVPIRIRVADLQSQRFRGIRIIHVGLDFIQVQVAVVTATGTFHRQAVIGHYVQAQRCQPLQ